MRQEDKQKLLDTAKFLEEHPDHYPILDDDGKSIGVASPVYFYPLPKEDDEV